MPETTLATIHFPPALRDWITQGLQRGGAPDHMAQALASQGYDPLVARELVAAFARARREGTPAPRDSITVSRAVPAAAGGPRPFVFQRFTSTFPARLANPGADVPRKRNSPCASSWLVPCACFR